jgi:hypothetical protein
MSREDSAWVETTGSVDHLGMIRVFRGNHTFVVVSHTHWDREWYQPFVGPGLAL